MAGEADAVEVVAADDGGAGRAAEWVEGFASVQGVGDLAGESWGIVGGDEEAVVMVGEDFADGRGIGGDEEASHGHGFEGGPGEDERGGEVDEDRGGAEGGVELGLGEGVEEVDAGGVGEGDLCLELLAPGAAGGGGRAVEGFVAAEDEDLAVGAAAEEIGEGAVEGGEAAGGLEAAGVVDDDLVVAAEELAIGELDGGVGVRAQELGIDAFVDDADLGLVEGGVAAPLPAGGGEAVVDGGEGEEVRGVVEELGVWGPGAGAVGGGSGGAEEPLEVTEDGGLGKDGFEEEGFAPAGVTDDEVGLVALAGEGGAALGGGVGVGEGEVPGGFGGAGGFEGRGAVAEEADALGWAPGLAGEEGDLVLAGLGEVLAEVEELAGEALVEEEDLERAGGVRAAGHAGWGEMRVRGPGHVGCWWLGGRG